MVELRAPIEHWANKDLKAGLHRAQVEAANKKAEAEAEAQNQKNRDAFAPLWLPRDQWEKSDREGKMGRRTFFEPVPSEAYRRGYEAIDWNA